MSPLLHHDLAALRQLRVEARRWLARSRLDEWDLRGCRDFAAICAARAAGLAAAQPHSVQARRLAAEVAAAAQEIGTGPKAR